MLSIEKDSITMIRNTLTRGHWIDQRRVLYSPLATVTKRISKAMISSSRRAATGFVIANMSRRWVKWVPRQSYSSSGEPDECGIASESFNRSYLEVLPMERGSHGSAKIIIPPIAASAGTDQDPFEPIKFCSRLEATISSCHKLGKTSLWVYVPMQRCSLIEKGKMLELGFKFHHAIGDTAVLNKWLLDSESKIPDYATHVVGAAAVVVNSRSQILCVRELRTNYLPWKTPTGLLEPGEDIEKGVVREVYEETGVKTRFRHVMGFRHAHGVAQWGRSDICFICRLDPIETWDDENGNWIIPEPVAQQNEIEKVAWVQLSIYRDMVNGAKGHPMMSRIMDIFDAGWIIDHVNVESIVPGRQPSMIYYPFNCEIKGKEALAKESWVNTQTQ